MTHPWRFLWRFACCLDVDSVKAAGVDLDRLNTRVKAAEKLVAKGPATPAPQAEREAAASGLEQDEMQLEKAASVLTTDVQQAAKDLRSAVAAIQQTVRAGKPATEAEVKHFEEASQHLG